MPEGRAGELLASLKITEHRGPDSRGILELDLEGYRVGLGHNRLSIIDLSSSGDQPMSIDPNLTIIFNGEVYNFLDLKNELKALGHKFGSGTDTEVVLRSYQEWGTLAFEKFRGMFSFAILDQNSRKLHVVRDAIGVKPLYIYKSENSIYGCSEIRGLRQFSEVNAEICPDQIFEFFNHGFLYEPRTGFKYIYKLAPGHRLSLSLVDGSIETTKYIDLNNISKPKSLEHSIRSAALSQSQADVPIGTFFSGGMDSSILANLSPNRDLLFASYETGASDLDKEYATKISQHLNKNLVLIDLDTSTISKDQVLEAIQFVAINTEEPISDFTFWPTYRLSMKARELGYKSMISGMGGDESFCGYPKYAILRFHTLFRCAAPFLQLVLLLGLVPKKYDKRYARLVSYCSENSWPLAYGRLLGYFSSKELKGLFPSFQTLNSSLQDNLNSITEEFKGNKNDKVKLAQFMDMKGFLAHNLTVADKASMLASIELRVPLLNEDVVATGLAMHKRELLENNTLKAPLHKLLHQLLPKNLVDREKTGFNPPLDNIIQVVGADTIRDRVRSLSQIVDTTFAERLIMSHFNGESNHTYKLWQLLYFSFWYEHAASGNTD